MATFENVKDLKSLLSAEGPCLSVYMPLSTPSEAGLNPNAKQNELRWKECLHSLAEKVVQFGPRGRQLLDSVKNWDAVAPGNGTAMAKSIAVFRSPDVLEVILLDRELSDRAVLAPRFFIRPWLAELVRDRRFFLLALSQKNTRLLRCTMHASEEVPFPSDVKTDFEQWMNQAKPDHTAVHNAMAASAQGASGPNALAPKGSDQDSKDEYLAHYFKQVDRGVNELLKGKTEPLVLCAVEYEIPIYREVNSYPHLASEAVRGAPNGLKSGEMHTRAMEALELDYNSRLDDVLANWNHRVGAGASSRLKDVVTAAHDGRVLTLLLSDSQEKTGVFNEAAHIPKARDTGSVNDEDLVNDAAVQTILHAGKVLVAPHSKMPNGSAVAALFRY
jgi:Bacterial archaeo-eukaryotic release factor family 3